MEATTRQHAMVRSGFRLTYARLGLCWFLRPLSPHVWKIPLVCAKLFLRRNWATCIGVGLWRERDKACIASVEQTVVSISHDIRRGMIFFFLRLTLLYARLPALMLYSGACGPCKPAWICISCFKLCVCISYIYIIWSQTGARLQI